ncbi:MAG: hypothetical protein ABI923_14475, partial [bacterium]
GELNAPFLTVGLLPRHVSLIATHHTSYSLPLAICPGYSRAITKSPVPISVGEFHSRGGPLKLS